MTARFAKGGPLAVSTTGTLELPGAPPVMVAADLVYEVEDCLAVDLVLHGPDDMDVSWIFGWDLLDRGLTAPAGEGDVRVAPVPAAARMIEVLLDRSFGARILFPARDIARFVDTVRPLADRDLPRVAADLDLELTAITEGW